MTSGRLWLAALCLLATGCDEEGAPCTDCPALEGRYALVFAEGTLPAACASEGVGLPRGPLDLQRSGSQLTGSVEGVALQGSVYANSTFLLLGSQGLDGGSDSLSFNGTYSGGSPDGGTDAQLTGSLTRGFTRAGSATAPCSLVRSFTATRQ
ncbi:hypothetical protein SAMN05444354_10279 [Stigmatella aurantiaca]|uniref:Lipoprotein n=1 Tax=Stigmatella aurantiaca TaxID=41 RepID=A0A1H7J395_STIAU|nr:MULTISPECIES: hypothetical protein [Stigmatella]SEK68367.1 hypothetical protein SAMN05444354_10279 [Stigmatella aurantiaca]